MRSPSNGAAASFDLNLALFEHRTDAFLDETSCSIYGLISAWEAGQSQGNEGGQG